MRAARKWQGAYEREFRIRCMQAVMMRLDGLSYGEIGNAFHPPTPWQLEIQDRRLAEPWFSRSERRHIEFPKESKARYWVEKTPAAAYVASVLLSVQKSATRRDAG